MDGEASARSRPDHQTKIGRAFRQGPPRLLAPARPRQTDDGGAVHDWKESRTRPLEDGQRRPASEKSGHEVAASSLTRASANAGHVSRIARVSQFASRSGRPKARTCPQTKGMLSPWT